MRKRMTVLNLAIVMVLIGSLVLTSVVQGADTEFATLAELIDGRLADWTPVISADDLYEVLNDGDTSNDPFVLSVRSTEDYATGHIPGAYNIPWRNVADESSLAMLPADQQIVVYCYTGHTGQVAATILRVLGYDATNLKYGMMGWTNDDAVLAQPRFSKAAGYPVETEAHELTTTHEPPALATGKSAAAEIALARARAFLADWSPVISADDLYESLNDGDPSTDPFVLSVRAADAYALGHIAGAYNIPWKSVAKLDNLAKLPADHKIVAYCYTGHTGEAAATALAMLGYDVTNLKFGMMGWNEDALGQTGYSQAPGYPVAQLEAVQLPETGIAPAFGGPSSLVLVIVGLTAIVAISGGVYATRKQ